MMDSSALPADPVRCLTLHCGWVTRYSSPVLNRELN